MRHTRKQAFTLVELIVVIGVIAILIALLMPALSRARRQADIVDCLARLRSIGQAAQINVNEHDGYLPLAGWQWNCDDGDRATPEGLGDLAERKYVYYIDEGVKRPVPTTAAIALALGFPIRTDSRESLEADMARPEFRRLFHCPAQTSPLSGATMRGDGPNGTWIAPEDVCSYAFNEAMLGRRPGEEAKTCPQALLARAIHQSEVFLALDGRPRDQATENFLLVYNFGPDDTFWSWDQQCHQTGRASELPDFWRHDRKVNAVFLDGHAQTFSMDEGGMSQIGVSHGIEK